LRENPQIEIAKNAKLKKHQDIFNLKKTIYEKAKQIAPENPTENSFKIDIVFYFDYLKKLKEQTSLWHNAEPNIYDLQKFYRSV
jgi:hypothetical protein